MNSSFIRRVFLFLLLSLVLVTTGTSQSLEFRIDSLLGITFQDKGPGAVFLVTKAGKPIYRKAFGEANLELHVPMVPEQVFEIGSMTKQFTAVSVLLLMEQGKLGLQDDITMYIPGYPTQGEKITIHHLLTHTSGIKNFTAMKTLREIERNGLTPLELIDFFKAEPMDFAPGAQFRYSNSGYAVLGYIIEAVSGQTYAEFVQEHIFDRLGMTSSRYASHTEIIENRAYGYQAKDTLYNKSYISYSLPYAAGSLMSTVDDLAIWNQSLQDHVLLSKETTGLAFSTYALADGQKIDYGYGWHILRIGNSPSWEHGGSIFGFKSMGVYLPQEDIYVIGLSNCDCNSPTELVRQVAEMAMSADYP